MQRLEGFCQVENVSTRGDVTRTWKLPSEPAGTDRTAYFHSCKSGDVKRIQSHLAATLAAS